MTFLCTSNLSSVPLSLGSLYVFQHLCLPEPILPIFTEPSILNSLSHYQPRSFRSKKFSKLIHCGRKQMVGARVMGWFGVGELTAKGHKENFWSNGKTIWLDDNGDYVGVHIYQTVSLKQVHFIACKSNFIKFFKVWLYSQKNGNNPNVHRQMNA